MKIVLSAEDLSPDDYVRSGCDMALATCSRRWKSDYAMAVAGRIEAAGAAGDEQATDASRVIFAVLMMREPWSGVPVPDEDDPIVPTYQLDDSAYAYLGVLLGLAPTGSPAIGDNEVRARGADLLYQRSITTGGKRDFRAAALAVESYLAEAAACQATHGRHWSEAEDRVKRAFEIASELKSIPLKAKVVEHITVALAAFAPMVQSTGGTAPISAPSRYPLQLLRLLLHHFRKGDPIDHAKLAERLAQEARAAQAWGLARDYLGVATEWHALAGESRCELAAQERSAEAWIEQGVAMVSKPDTQDFHYLLAEHKLQEGIQALRATVGLAKKRGLEGDAIRLAGRIEAVRRLHLDYQERGVRGLLTYRTSSTMDSAPIFAVVEGKDKIEALFAMTQIGLPSRTEVEAQVREEREDHILSPYFALRQLEERGRSTALSNGYSDGGTGDADLWARMCQRAVQIYGILAQIHVGPHQWKIEQEHSIDLSDFARIVRVSPFVPAGREPLFARGLYAGMTGDFTLALHLLIPQVEHAIRVILRYIAANDENLRIEYADTLADPELPSLRQSLYEPWASKLAQFLGIGGEDVVFALRVLLIERFGGNLRNRALHGLSSYGALQGWRCWYLWWLILRICCSTAINTARKTETKAQTRILS